MPFEIFYQIRLTNEYINMSKLEFIGVCLPPLQLKTTRRERPIRSKFYTNLW